MKSTTPPSSESVISALWGLVEKATHSGKAGFMAESVGKFVRYKLVEDEGLWGERFAQYAPAVGEFAPNFRLRPLEQKRAGSGCAVPEEDISQIAPSGFVSLTNYQDKRPVVLVFGSYT